MVVLSVHQYRKYTTKRRGRLVRTPGPYIHYHETWSSSPYPIPFIHHQGSWSSCPFTNTVNTLQRDVVVLSVHQYRKNYTKRRGCLVRTPIRYIHHQETCSLVRTRITYIHDQVSWSSSPYPNTVHTLPRDEFV